jgi:hypothetical protein
LEKWHFQRNFVYLRAPRIYISEKNFSRKFNPPLTSIFP